MREHPQAALCCSRASSRVSSPFSTISRRLIPTASQSSSGRSPSCSLQIALYRSRAFVGGQFPVLDHFTEAKSDAFTILLGTLAAWHFALPPHRPVRTGKHAGLVSGTGGGFPEPWDRCGSVVQADDARSCALTAHESRSDLWYPSYWPAYSQSLRAHAGQLLDFNHRPNLSGHSGQDRSDVFTGDRLDGLRLAGRGSAAASSRNGLQGMVDA